MANLTGRERSQYVRRMFGRIAPRYDLLNRLMTGGQDVRCRRVSVDALEMSPGVRILDVGAGTGDIAFEAHNRLVDGRVIATDLTYEMMALGRRKPGGDCVDWVLADALHLPFAEGVFEGVISGYLLRNVPDVPAALDEQHRVLSPGGRMVSLDTTPPRKNLLKPLIDFYMHRVIPLLGRLITGDAAAYTYLPDTTANFIPAEKLAGLMEQTGFSEVSFVRRLFGVMAIHRGQKG
jgi:demethylmenaquinone methyltransferase / 2-methoxy-6-polyprenyl-1,4-benzoquinol methylase